MAEKVTEEIPTAETTAEEAETEAAPSTTTATATVTKDEAKAAAAKQAALEFESKVAELSKRGEPLGQRGREAYERVNAEIHKSEDVAAAAASQFKEAEIMRAEISKAASKKTIAKEDASRLIKQIREHEAKLKEVQSLLSPDTGGTLVRLAIGKCNIKLHKEGERFALKNDYEKFKRRSIVPFLVLILLSFYFTHSNFLKCIMQLWSMAYFTSLALRENILRVNGSAIRRWWIDHHYISAVLSVVFVLWPANSATYQSFRPLFLVYLLCQLVVQYLQSEYQMARLYKMVAMGKASPMDVTGEAIPIHSWAPNIVILYPFVTGVQLMQFVVAYKLLRMSWDNHFAEWPIPTAGFLSLILASGNLIATHKVYWDKWRKHVQETKKDDARRRSADVMSPTESEAEASASETEAPVEDRTPEGKEKQY